MFVKFEVNLPFIISDSCLSDNLFVFFFARSCSKILITSHRIKNLISSLACATARWRETLVSGKVGLGEINHNEPLKKLRQSAGKQKSSSMLELEACMDRVIHDPTKNISWTFNPTRTQNHRKLIHNLIQLWKNSL